MHARIMTLTQLAYAVAVDRYRHFGKAAEHCHVSQPTLSMQLRKLEEELGVRLFDRTKKPVLPTEAGKRILQQARLILEGCQHIEALAREEVQAPRGLLKLGMLPTLASYVLPWITQTLGQRYPGLHVQVEERTTREILQALEEERLDAGLIATEERLPGLKQEALFCEPFVAYMHPEHPLLEQPTVHPAQLNSGELWLLREGHCFREQTLQICGQPVETGPQPRLQIECGHLETLRLMVDRLGGMTLLPLLMVHVLPPEARRRVRLFQAPAPGRTVYLVCTRYQLRAPLMDALTQVIRQAIVPRLNVEDLVLR